MSQSQWLNWMNRLQAIAQNGLAFTTDPYDKDRYEQLRDLASEIAASYTETEMQPIRDLYAQETGYMTPKVDVRGAVFKDDKILLVQEMADEGRWSLPGGWADIYDSPSEAVLREIREEAGYEARILKLAAVYDRERHGHPPYPFHAYKLFFVCEPTSEKLDILHGHESGESAFFSLDDLPTLSIGRIVESQLRRCYAHYQNPALPTDFD